MTRKEQAKEFIADMEKSKQEKIEAIAAYVPDDVNGANYVVTCAGLSLRLEFAGYVGREKQFKTGVAGGAQKATRFCLHDAAKYAARIQNGGGTVAIAEHLLDALNREVREIQGSIEMLQNIE